MRGGTGRRGGRGSYSQDVMYKRRIEAKKKKKREPVRKWKERVFWAEGWLERKLGIERLHQQQSGVAQMQVGYKHGLGLRDVLGCPDRNWRGKGWTPIRSRQGGGGMKALTRT